MNTQPDSLLDFKRVSFAPRGRLILKNIDFTLHRGEIVTVLGPNGAGKSTIAKLALGLIQPTSGQITRSRALSLGYMPQKIQFDRTLPLTTHYFLSLLSIKPTRSQIQHCLNEVGAGYLIDQSLHNLSGGELQRVLLARALLLQPDLLVLDEPAQGVDIVGQQELYSLISKINRSRGCAILLISHDLHLVMASTNRVICVNQHICCSGHPDAVSQDPAYLNLFGREGSEQLAVYAHHHDHTHDLSGHLHNAALRDHCNHSHHSHSSNNTDNADNTGNQDIS